jgi:hypothetical protein
MAYIQDLQKARLYVVAACVWTTEHVCAYARPLSVASSVNTICLELKCSVIERGHSPLLQPGSTLLAFHSRPARILARWDTTPLCDEFEWSMYLPIVYMFTYFKRAHIYIAQWLYYKNND